MYRFRGLLITGRGYVVLLIWIICAMVFGLFLGFKDDSVLLLSVPLATIISSYIGWRWKRQTPTRRNDVPDSFLFVPLGYTWVTGLLITLLLLYNKYG